MRNRRVEVARLLIEYGASLTQPSNQGVTPLDWASEYLDPAQRKALLRSDTGEADTQNMQD